MSKYVVVKRNTGSSKYGNDYKDCQIIIETDDLDEAYWSAVSAGYKTHDTDFSGVRIFEQLVVKPVVEKSS